MSAENKSNNEEFHVPAAEGLETVFIEKGDISDINAFMEGVFAFQYGATEKESQQGFEKMQNSLKSSSEHTEIQP